MLLEENLEDEEEAKKAERSSSGGNTIEMGMRHVLSTVGHGSPAFSIKDTTRLLQPPSSSFSPLIAAAASSSTRGLRHRSVPTTATLGEKSSDGGGGSSSSNQGASDSDAAAAARHAPKASFDETIGSATLSAALGDSRFEEVRIFLSSATLDNHKASNTHAFAAACLYTKQKSDHR